MLDTRTTDRSEEMFWFLDQTVRRAWVGDRRAARMAGRSPARAPMMTAAARPPAQACGRDDDGLAVAAGVGGGGGRAGDDSGGAAGQGQQDGLGQELGADLAAGGAQRAAQPDLGAALQHGDDHDVGHPDRADQQRDRAQAEEQGVERALGVGPGGERVRGLGDVDLAGVFRVGLRAEQAVDGGGGLGVRGADVDLCGCPSKCRYFSAAGKPTRTAESISGA